MAKVNSDETSSSCQTQYPFYTFIDEFHLQKRRKIEDNQNGFKVIFLSQSELFLLVILFESFQLNQGKAELEASKCISLWSFRSV